MRVRVLGCYGGSTPGRRPTCLLVDGRLALDAGALTEALTVEEQLAVDEVYVTHAHLDHVAQLPFLLDNVFARRQRPVRVLGSAAALATLREHVFNDRLWPDFARLSNGATVLLEYVELASDREHVSDDLTLVPFAMEHTVPCHGYLLQARTSSLLVCGDTWSLEALPRMLDRARGPRGVLLEVSFPERAAQVADASKHLTPGRFAELLAGLRDDIPFYVWHLKPDLADELRDEIAALGLAHVELLEQDREYAF